MDSAKFTFENIGGMRFLRVKEHPIMSSGIWNDWYYDEAELRDAFNRTDWTNPKTLELYYDHNDDSARAWIGKIENPKLKGNTIYGDVLIATDDAQKAMILGTRFGISPKISGTGNDIEKSVKDFSFENWSYVTDPACKTTFLNSSKKDTSTGVILTPQKFFMLKQVGDKMNEEIKGNEETPAPEAVKEELKETAEKVGARNSDRDEYMIKRQNMLRKLNSLGFVDPNFKAFQTQYLKENPDASLKELSRAWRDKQIDMRVEGLVQQKLAAQEKGEKVSKKSEGIKTQETQSDNRGFSDVDVAMLQFLRDEFQSKNAGVMTFELGFKPSKAPLGNRTWELSSTATSTSSARGTVFSAASYPLQPVEFLKSAIDAAKENLYFQQVTKQFTLPENSYEMVVPYRTAYLADSSWQDAGEEVAAGSELSFTEINTADGKKITPTRYNFGVALTNKAIRTSALQEVQYAREELAYKYENSVDSKIRDAILGDVTTGGTSVAPTEMSNTVRGAQTIFGGDATDASNSLDSGDVFTTQMLIKARRLLMSTRGYYWNSNTWTVSGTAKNAWQPSPSEPFIQFISPEQEEALLNETKFTNAAEYGSNEILLNGEIGKFVGVKVLCTTKVPSFISGQEVKVQGSQATQNVTGHMLGLLKAGRCGATVWEAKPEIKLYDWPNADQVRFKLTLGHATDDIFADAIVRQVVSDE